MSLRKGETLIAGSGGDASAGKLPGELVTTTIPMTDAGLHLADGTALSSTGAYADFYNYFVTNQDTFADHLCTETEWQESAAAYGVCGKYVLDTDAGTLRLPLITGFIEGATNDVGGLNAAGLPNIEGAWRPSGGNGLYVVNVSGAVAANDVSGTSVTSITGTSSTTTSSGAIFDASLSNDIYGNSDTVQPQSIKVYYYIVVGNVDESSITVDALALKADTDMSNVSDAGKETVVGWGMPDLSKGEGFIEAVGSWTVPYDCEIWAYDSTGSVTSGTIIRYGTSSGSYVFYACGNDAGYGSVDRGHFRKGTALYIERNNSTASYIAPLMGVES